MYGFLRTPNCQLNKTDGDSYKKSYCGQCHALQKHFGYTSRALLSYDTTLISLLIDAQSQSKQRETKAWCAVFPRKVPVYHPDEMAQKMSASLAVALLFTKLSDALQEKKSFLKTVLAKYYQRQFNQARKILESEGFNTDLIDQVLANQAQVELKKSPRIEDYAEPSARFAGEVFRFTATLANLKQNENLLYEIGYHVGKIVYLIDSCIDILDDVDKQQFNALLATYQDSNGFSATRSQHEVVRMVIDSLRTIQTLTKQLTLYQHQSLVEGILLQGFPSRLHQQVHKSIQKLEKNAFIPVNYLPHAALASALCLFATEANAAGIVWGKNYDGIKVYGCTSLNYDNVKSWRMCYESCFNPFVCICDTKAPFCSLCHNFCKCALFSSFTVGSAALYDRIKNGYETGDCKDSLIGSGIFVSFLFVILISLITFDFISKKYENYLVRSEIEEKKESIHSFVETFSPKLHLNLQKINNSITVINTKIQNLQKLQSQFPAQTDVVQPKIAKLTELKKHLEETLRNIQAQLRTAYVIHQANQIEGIGQSVFLDEILKQADEALEQAKIVSVSVGETTQ